METKVGSREIDNLKQKFNFFGFVVLAVGRSSGLALLWNKNVNLMVQSFSSNHIDANVS